MNDHDGPGVLLERCPICGRLVLKGHHGQAECERLASVRNSMHIERYEASDVTTDNISRILQRLKETMEEHERTCGLCSYWVKEDSIERCDDYLEMMITRCKWGKRHDDSH
jgi:hypothetical protein